MLTVRLECRCCQQFSVGQEASIGFLRQAEIKHGRVAMAAFVGYIVQSNGIYWPWALTTSGITHADISAAGGPADQWDALPTASKVQILLFVGARARSKEPPPPLRTSGCAGCRRGCCRACACALAAARARRQPRLRDYRSRRI